MCIQVNKNGDRFLDLISVGEDEIENNELYAPLTHSLIIVRCKERYLLCFNIWRKQWEVPGGGIDEGETPRQCAVRELYEETNQKVEAKKLRYKGLMEFCLQPDRRLEYGALYSVELEGLTEFEKNDEMSEIVLWDGLEDIGYINEIDQRLLEFY